MKKLLLLAAILLPTLTFAQKFYVTPTEKQYELPVTQTLSYQGVEVVANREEADYVIDCLLAPKGGGNYKGYLKITDAKTGKELAKSKEVSKSAAAMNGFNPGKRIFEVIAKKHLTGLIEGIKKQL